ncbi:M28 family peptidase [Kineosporia sp. NBRC 101731]|uniref:M28 family peptidase n=1 Tax=Kineosporia sp. NBRC 101731 TaxID=3032199 RepID=UPI0024A20CCA|nr:M28 family peptidase [Kineosporia sp. NBRC 101731]GLY29252.1 hypothetical protein Kisp02_26170 [Kineosporia sp. NBRC 101731]
MSGAPETADEQRVEKHVRTLAAGPRGRRHHPQALQQAMDYIATELDGYGWTTRHVPFVMRWAIGVTEKGGTAPLWRRVRLYRRLEGTNLLAHLPQHAPDAPAVLLIAHVDSVENSPGADDNASGVAAVLECARLLATLPDPPVVRLAFVDMEELGKMGSRALAGDRRFRQGLRHVVCLESVGTFTSEPGSQQVGVLRWVFPQAAAEIASQDGRGDFVLAICKRSSRRAADTIRESADRVRVLVGQEPRPDGLAGRLVTQIARPLRNLDRSDHAPFWDRGVPSLMLTCTASFRNHRYHLPEDVAEEVDFGKVAQLSTAVVRALARGF